MNLESCDVILCTAEYRRDLFTNDLNAVYIVHYGEFIIVQQDTLFNLAHLRGTICGHWIPS